MNNEQISGDQLIQLQNFAYLKQFMSKLSIKVLMVASFLQAIIIAVFYFFMSGFFKDSIYNIAAFAGSSSVSGIENTENVLSVFSGLMTVGGIIAVVFGLILPVTLLIITLRASNDDPTVIPKGAVSFLHVISIIQFIFSILAVVMGLISTIFGISSSENGNNVVSSVVFSVMSYVLSCLYYYYQMKFLSSVKLSCNGYSLMSAGSHGFGVCSTIYAVISGIAFVLMAIISIVFSAFSSTTQLGGGSEWQMLVEFGFMDIMVFILVFCTIICLTSMIVQIAMAITAFGYKNTVTEAVRASYAVAGNNPYNRANATVNSPFRTYGGGSVYSNYNYSNSGGQQGHQHSASNSAVPVKTGEKTKSPDFSQRPQSYDNYGGGSFSPENHNYDNYGGGSFSPENHNYDNYGGGSFPPENHNYDNYGGGSFSPENHNYDNYGGGSFSPENHNYDNYGGGSFSPENHNYDNSEGNSFPQNNEYLASGSVDNPSYNSNDNTPSNSSFFQ